MVSPQSFGYFAGQVGRPVVFEGRSRGSHDSHDGHDEHDGVTIMTASDDDHR
jgi:hypothetical protein